MIGGHPFRYIDTPRRYMNTPLGYIDTPTAIYGLFLLVSYSLPRLVITDFLTLPASGLLAATIPATSPSLLLLKLTAPSAVYYYSDKYPERIESLSVTIYTEEQGTTIGYTREREGLGAESAARQTCCYVKGAAWPRVLSHRQGCCVAKDTA